MRKLLLILMLLSAIALQASRRCLLIGVGHYPEGSGWQPINSVNDIRLLEKSLVGTWKVSTLCDKDATFDGICKAINDLIRQTNVGDTVLVHFSGHGQQMLTNDPTEVDHLDEAFVPYDAKIEDSRKYHGQNHLRDDLLSTFISKLRNKISSRGLLVVTMDDCHSGSMNRGKNDEIDIYRGTADIFGQNTISKDSLLNITKYFQNESRDIITKDDEGSDVIFLSACKANEKNREIEKGGVHYGPLSYAIAAAYSEIGLNDIREFLDRINSHMEEYVPFQTPQTINSIGYSFKTDTIDTAYTTPIVDSKDDGEHENLLIWLITSIASLVIFLLVWKKIRK